MDQPLWSFELLGFRVQVWATFVLLSAFLALFAGMTDPLLAIGFIGLVFVSIVVHELGHAFVARRFGLPVGAIQLRGLGGQVSHGRTTHANQLAISLAGPGAGLLLAVAAFAVSVAVPLPGTLGVLMGVMISINVVWSLFNLLPILPMDGGNALRAGLSLFMPERQALKLAVICTMGVAGLGAVWALSSGSTYLVLFLGYFGYRGFQMYQQVA